MILSVPLQIQFSREEGTQTSHEADYNVDFLLSGSAAETRSPINR